MVSREKQLKIIIDQYLQAYNNFNIDGMVKHLHPNVEFKNITGDEVNVYIQGLETLKMQAQDSTKLFKKREMKITKQTINGDVIINKIDFKAVFNIDIPNGPQSGELIKFKNESVFKFKGDKIISIADIS